MNNWLIRGYIDDYKKATGVDKLEENENNFLREYFNIDKDPSSKKIYYYAIYRFRRKYPKFWIKFKISQELKIAFKTNNAPTSLLKAHNIFAETMFFNALKTYCKLPIE